MPDWRCVSILDLSGQRKDFHAHMVYLLEIKRRGDQYIIFSENPEASNVRSYRGATYTGMYVVVRTRAEHLHAADVFPMIEHDLLLNGTLVRDTNGFLHMKEENTKCCIA